MSFSGILIESERVVAKRMQTCGLRLLLLLETWGTCSHWQTAQGGPVRVHMSQCHMSQCHMSQCHMSQCHMSQYQSHVKCHKSVAREIALRVQDVASPSNARLIAKARQKCF
jgi:hypothetical protein